MRDKKHEPRWYAPSPSCEWIDISLPDNCPLEYRLACEKNLKDTGRARLPIPWDYLRKAGPDTTTLNKSNSPFYMHNLGIYILNNWDMPHGDPEEWDLEQETVAHQIAEAYANEYMKDMDIVATAQRLGARGDVEGKSRDVFNHPLTKQHIQKNIENFCSTNTLTHDTVLAILWRHANSDNAGVSLTAVSKLLDLSGLSSLKEPPEEKASTMRTITAKDAKTLKEAFDEKY
jgi:hypothetical protein